MLGLEEAYISMSRSSIAGVITLAKLNGKCFRHFAAAMFVPNRRAQAWRLHTKNYRFGRHTSVDNALMKNSRDLILGKVV